MATPLSEARSEGARHVLAGGALKDLIGLEPHELEGIYTIAYTELEQGQLDRGERMCLGLTSTRRGGRRRVAAGELNADAPDRGADMA
jgi:hypothetical protein